jgi:nitrous oxidase accessory protein
MLSSIKKNKTTVTLAKAIIMLLVLSFVLFSFSESLTAKAEAKTIVVPDDFSSIQDAIDNAHEYDTIFVKEGTHEEHSLVINKTLILVGEDASTTIIKNIDISPAWDPSLNPFPPPPIIAIQINASNVKISNFTITRAVGVFADGTEIVDNFVESTSLGIIMNSNNNTIARNSLSGIGTEGFIKCTGSYNSILENTINGSTSLDLGAVYIKGSFNSVYSNAITDTSSFNYSRVKVYGDENSITKNNITNGEIRIDGSGNIVRANSVTSLVVLGYNNTFTANNISYALSIYINKDGTADHVFYHNNFIADPKPSITFSDWTQGQVFFDNGSEGNYWSDYNGTDNNGDGIGDTPYVIGFNRKDNYPLMTPVDINTIPEFPSWAILPLLVAVTLIAVLYTKRLHKSSHSY